MKLTKSELAYLERFPSSAMYTCADCGKRGIGYYVQPQLPRFNRGVDGLALCCECITRLNEAARQKRQEALSAAPRCEADGCKHRGNWRVQGVLLCGRHKAKVMQRFARAGARNPVFLFTAPTAADVRATLKGA